jgi:hypothetical protein
MCRRGRVFLIIGCLAQLALAQTSSEAKLTLSERAFTASKVYSMLQFYFSNWKTLPDLDLDIAYRNYLDKALATEDRRQFDLATMEFVARLHNGHTLFSDSWLTQDYGQPMGFYARSLDGKWVVEISGLPSVKPGDVLSKLEDTDIETYFRQQQKYISGSSEAAQRHNFFFLTYLFPEPPIALETSFPALKTGVGIVATMQVTPPQNPAGKNWNGTPITEAFIDTFSTCPSSGAFPRCQASRKA